MPIIHAFILGIIEGITEFLPVSSTGHLILTSNILGLRGGDFLKTFEIAIQLGAILAVVFIYWRRVFPLSKKQLPKWFGTWKKILVAFLPAGFLGLVFYKVIKNFLDSNDVVIWSLFLGGAVLIIFEKWHKEKSESAGDFKEISYFQAFGVGLFQSIAMIPGVSRSAATIIGGLYLGLKRKTIVEFSFLLAVPTMFAAVSFDLLKNLNSFSLDQMHFLLLGFLASFIFALVSVKFLLRFIQKHSFFGFGVYRMIVAVLFFLIFYFKR